MITIERRVLSKHPGYAAFLGNAGIFVYWDEGEFNAIKYKRIRICRIFKAKLNNKVYHQYRIITPDERRRDRVAERVGIPPELVEAQMQMEAMIMREQAGKEVKIPEVEKPANIQQESTELDETDKLIDKVFGGIDNTRR